MKGFTDIHNHFLYGIDDGPQDFDGMTRILDAAAKEGFTRLIATPHMTPGVVRFDYDAFNLHFAQAQTYCSDAGLPLTLYRGAEVFYTQHTARYLSQGRIPTLASTQYVLVEFLPQVPLAQLKQALQVILRSGCIPVLAHAERYTCLVKSLRDTKALKETVDVRFQINAQTIIKGRGFWVDRFVKHMLAEGLVDYIATDAHNTANRPVAILAAYDMLCAAYGDAVGNRLTGLAGLGSLGLV